MSQKPLTAYKNFDMAQLSYNKTPKNWCLISANSAPIWHLSGAHPMTTKALVRARIDEKLKNEAAIVLAEMGLTVSDVIRIALTKIAKERVLPFDMQIPNSLTIETLEKSERGEDIYQAEDADDLFEKLGI